MSDEVPRRHSRRRRRVIIATVVLVLLAAGAWIGGRGLAANRHLNRAEVALETAKKAIQTRHPATARDALDRAGHDTASARALTSDPVWRLAGAIPYLGRTPRAATVVAAATDDIVRRALPPLATAADRLDPARLRPTGDRVDLAALTRAQPLLDRGDRQIADAQQRLAAVRGPVLWPVNKGLARVRTETASLHSISSAARQAAHLLPPMLGADGPRAYFVGVLNPAEARGTGGFLGAYGVVEARQGELSLVKLGSNSALKNATTVPVDLGPDYTALYGEDPALWINANLSPHFPYAARIWTALYARQFGRQLDGVVTVDPILMGELLKATGPIKLTDGTTVTGAAAPDLVMSGIYQRFPGYRDDHARDAYLIDLGSKVMGAIFSGDGDAQAMLTALASGAQEGRLRLWSEHPAEQRRLSATAMAGVVPTTPAPFAEVVVNNGGANKLDYYLDRDVRYSLGPCAGGRRATSLTVRLTNGAPGASLPPYVLGSEAPDAAARPPAGVNRTLLYVFTTHGARLTGATVDGKKLAVRQYAERGHPVFAFPLDLVPKVARTVRLTLDEPATAGAPRVVEQPLARAQHTVLAGNSC
ncbi:MAG: hypothetical protein QOF98_2719 [Streptomyces sp.]|nr:hypothetical protein [Streptomyces sp.]